ncbi:MAG TPA: MoaD/ThiS family protein [Propionibacteriaceae bacterium]|nr:MoaD/ThiS family protein [Propionibacteriaceae bacterium]HPZ49586.1 MoaD/ThiS family protein [Propionibacteriaceae bacterium]
MAVVSIRYWASLRAAAGVERDVLEASSAQAVLDAVRELHPDPEFTRVLGLCAIMLDGRRIEPTDDRPLEGYVELEALPPFAGG